jgi:hypothetical protein
LFLAIVIAGLLNAVVPAQTQPPDTLRFFKNYFVTGDYVVGGVGLRGQGGLNGSPAGIATGWIRTSGAPEDAAGHPTADILAAFLYWQAVTKDGTGNAGVAGATFGPWAASLPGTPSAGIPLNTEAGPLGKILGTGTPPCWSSGGGTGSSGGAHLTYTYRTDVLRFLDIDETTGKYKVNGYYQVQLPDSVGVAAIGASLVVIYRDPAMPLNAIVMYEGGVTIDNSLRTWSLDVGGFYQPAAVAPDAKITYLVGSGQPNKYENVYFSYPGSPPVLLKPWNPFSASNGANWDSPSFSVSLGNSPTTVSQVTTTVDTAGLSGSDCLTVSGVLFKTAVQDTDGDGLLDAWESSPPPTNPYGVQLPDLAAMGASPLHKDVFVEIGWMTTNGHDYSYGGVTKPAHSHMPTPAAIKLMGNAFKKAPVDNPDGGPGIKLHIDAGPGYPACTPEEIAADECYIVAAALARGGEPLDESVTTPACTRDPAKDPVSKCLFDDYPGTVGWKTGFRYIRDQLTGSPPELTPDGDDPCDVPGYLEDGACRRRFDRNRHHMFHYAWFAHAVGLPKSVFACLDVSNPDNPVEAADVNGYCPAPLKENPTFFIPRTNSGIGDFPGGDMLVTLGAFSDRYGWPGGTDFMVASTFMHEFGHNIELRHGAWQDASGAVVPGPNCVPTYLSVMNYLYQLRGLLDNDGRPHLDFSSMGGPDTPITESTLADGALTWPAWFTPTYRIGWYAPWRGSYLEDPVTHLPRTTIAGSHCDGSPMRAGDREMVRIDAPKATGDVDWMADGDTTDNGFAQDVNFNGRTEPPVGSSPELPTGFNDWANIHLNQIGARRNVGGPFLDALGRKAFGPLSADLARWDWARWDWARAEWGGDDGRGDFGGGDMFLQDPNNPGGCLDHETATFLANTPPYEFTCVLEGLKIHCEWSATNEGNELRYDLYRVEGTELSAGQEWVPVTSVDATGLSHYSLTFDDPLKKGADYLYFATAVYQSEVAGATGEVESNPSDTAHIVGPDHAPVAVNDSYSTLQDAPLIIAAPGVLANDTDADGDALTAVLVSGPSHGALTLNANGSFTYTPASGYTGLDSFTYMSNDSQLPSNVATVTIAVKVYTLWGIQNVPPAPVSKAKAGSSVPMKWQYRDGSLVVDSSVVHHQVTVQSTTNPPPPPYTVSDTDPGSSSFRYDATTNAWYFNLQTKSASGVPFPVGDYWVTITPTTAGYLPSPRFKLTLTK